MGWFSDLTGIDTPDFIEDTGQHWDSWIGPALGAAITVLSGGTLAPLGMMVGGLGSGIHNYQTSGDYLSAGLEGLGGALGTVGAGNALLGAGAGWNAAGQAGKSLLGQLGGAGQGALFGTAGSGAGSYSLLNSSGGPVGLMGRGTLLGGTGGAMLNAGANMAQTAGSDYLTQQMMKDMDFGGYDMGGDYGTWGGGYTTPTMNVRPTYGTGGAYSIFGAPGSTVTGVDAGILGEDLYGMSPTKLSQTWQYGGW